MIKKLLTVILIILTSFTFISCNATDTTAITVTPTYLDIEFTNNYRYDLDTGYYYEDTNYATTTRTIAQESTLYLDTYEKTNYILFWDSRNQYIGYYCTAGTYTDSEMYLGTYTSNTIVIPEYAHKFAFMINKFGVEGYYEDFTYTYDEIFTGGTWGDYVIDSIDDNITVEGYESYTYRDIFGDSLFGEGKTNLIESGGFEDLTGWNSTYSSTELIDGRAYNTASGETTNRGILQTTGIVFETFDYHIYYVSADVETDNIKCIRLRTYIRNNIGLDTVIEINDPIINNVYKMSGIYDIQDTGYEYSYIRIEHAYDSLEETIDSSVYIDNVLTYNLTDIFGSGNEPSIEEFESMLEEYERITQFGGEELTLSDIDTTLYSIENVIDISGEYTATVDNTHTYFNQTSTGNYTFDFYIGTGGLNKCENEYILNEYFDTTTETFEYTSTAYIRTDYIPLNPSTDYMSSYYNTDTYNAKTIHIYGFDSNKDYVEELEYDYILPEVDYKELGFYTLEDVYYIVIVISWLGDPSTDIQVEVGNTVTTFSEYEDLYISIDVTEDSGGNAYIESNDITYIHYLLDHYTNEEYSDITITDYYFTGILDIVNPLLLEDVINIDKWITDSYRESILELYWSYKNIEQRYEWYTEYGVTESNFTDIYNEYQYLTEETTVIDLTTFVDIDVIINKNVIVYEDDTINDNINDYIEYVSPNEDSIIKEVIVIITLLAIAIVLGIFKANFNIILIVEISLIIMFTTLGWIANWILLLIAIILMILLVIKILQRRNS